MCSRRDFENTDYPALLLDPRTCTEQLLKHIYSLLPPSQPPIDKIARNAEIYQRFTAGESLESLAQAYHFTVKHIRQIIKHNTPKS
ncbi:MAG: hypothetical protein KF726_10010 [Anaerolineae bacterium]|nr:hypothetical protein [Anaerolineae bacterium]